MRSFVFRVLVVIALFEVRASNAQEEIYPGYLWHSLGNGIYVHSQENPFAGPVDGNSTVIVNEHGVVVVDTHINPAVARAVIEKIKSITDQAVTHVINTHWHDDHTNGNHAYRMAFPYARIIAHSATLNSLKDEWHTMEDGRRSSYASIDLAELLAYADNIAADDPGTAISYRTYAGYVAALRPELPTMELEYPDTVIDSSLSYDFGDRRVHIQWLGRGNTDGDIVVWLPDDSMLITGDLLVAPVPYAFDSPMTDWITTLDAVAQLEAEVLIPGHGAVQRDRQYLRQVRALIEFTVEAVREAGESGVAYADLANAVDFSSFEAVFNGNDLEQAQAWFNYFVSPGVASAWSSLGYPVPAETPAE